MWVWQVLRKRSHLAVVLAISLMLSVSMGPSVASHLVVRSGDIVNGQVKAPDLGKGAVATGKLRKGAVTTPKLRNNAVKPNKIAKGAVKTGKLRNGAVKRPKIANRAVGRAKVANLQWRNLRLANGWRPLDDDNETYRPQYAIDVQGVVHLRGSATRDDDITGSVLATLPPQARPARYTAVPILFNSLGCVRSGQAGGVLIITSNGRLTPDGAVEQTCQRAGIARSFDGVTFPAN